MVFGKHWISPYPSPERNDSKLQSGTCHRSDPYFQVAPELNLISSLKSLKFRLWDEDNNKMIGFRELKRQLAMEELRDAA